MFEILLVFCSLLFLFCKARTWKRMVDVLKGFQDVASWKRNDGQLSSHFLIETEKSSPKNHSTSTVLNGLSQSARIRTEFATKRFPQSNMGHMRKYNNLPHSTSKYNFYSAVDQFKRMPTVLPDVVNCSSSMRFSCTKCSPLIRRSLVDQVHDLGLKNIFSVDTLNSGYLAKKMHYLSFIFKTNANFTYPDISKEVLASERVTEAIEKAAMQEIEDQTAGTENYSKLLQKHRKRAVKLLNDMKSNISTFLIKLTAYVLFKVLSKLLRSIEVHKSQLEIVKKINQTSDPVIYLPLHRSHLDYILVTFILYNYELQAPIVAAGDNLRIPFFGPLLRGLGAFFIKRKLDPKKGKKDFIYRAILQTYMEQCLAKGHSLEFFIEGGRSRSGKACLPKAGLLSVVVDAFKDGKFDDAYIVPIGVSYEKLLDSGFLAEQLGKPKIMESFTSAVKGIWNIMNCNYGSVRVDFARPFSLKEFVKAAEYFQNTSPRSFFSNPPSPNATIRLLPSSTSLYGTDIVIEDQRMLVKGLAEHILHDAVHSTALMSTNLVAFLLLNKYRKGGMLKSLVQDFKWVWKEVVGKGRTVGFSGEAIDIVNHAIGLFGEKLVFVRRSDEHPDLAFITPNVESPQILELAYYSNVTISAFLGDAILATAMFNILGNEMELLNDCGKELTISKHKLIETSLDLCYILQYEFILTPPCVSLEYSIEEVIEEFKLYEIFLPDKVEDDDEECDKTAWATRFSKTIEDDDDDYRPYRDSFFKVNMSTACIKKLVFYRNILAPFIEGYLQLGHCLQHLIHNEMEERRFINLVQSSFMNKVSQGIIEYTECVAAETLRNGLNLLESWKVIDSCVHDNIKIIFLSDSYNSEEQIANVLSIFQEFKK